MIKRYKIEFNTDKNTRHGIILQRKGALDTTPTRTLQIAGEGYTLERDAPSSLFEPLRTLRLELPIEVEQNYQLEHITTDSMPWEAILSISGQIIFRGMIERSLHEEEYTAPPYTTTLTAVCGLSLLDDEYFALDTLPVNDKGLASLEAILRHILLQTGLNLPLQFGDLGGIALDQLFIDPEGWRATQGYVRNTEKAGEILRNIVRSLSLCVYQHEGAWIIERALAQPGGGTKVLDTQKLPIYNSATLSSEGAFGSVRINLPDAEHESIFRMPLPTFPLPTLRHTPHPVGEFILPGNRLCASEGIGSRPPTAEEAAMGVRAVLMPSYEGEERRIGIRCPYRHDKNVKDIEISIELGLPQVNYSRENIDFQAVGFIELGVEGESHYLSKYGITYQFLSQEEEIKPFIGNWETEEKRETEFFGTTKQRGRHREDFHCSFSSPFALMAWIMPPLKGGGAGNTMQQFQEAANRSLPWSRTALTNMEGGKLQTFTFKTTRLWDAPLFHDAQTRNYYGLAEVAFPDTLFFSLPMRFWGVTKRESGEDFNPEFPHTLYVGKIEVKYIYDKEVEFETFIVADLDNPFVREGEEIDLHLTTRIDAIKQPNDLKGMLKNEQGEDIRYLYAHTDIVQHTAEEFFALHGRAHDLFVAEINPVKISSLNDVYTLPSRPGKKYKIVGSVYTPAEQKEELTLHEIPQKREEASYA